jgi:hypothetical protein
MATGVAPHLHIGAVEFIVFLLYLLLAGAILRIVEVTQSGNRFGKALAFIY